jgi:hypothetical protein
MLQWKSNQVGMSGMDFPISVRLFKKIGRIPFGFTENCGFIPEVRMKTAGSFKMGNNWQVRIFSYEQMDLITPTLT